MGEEDTLDEPSAGGMEEAERAKEVGAISFLRFWSRRGDGDNVLDHFEG